MSAEHRDVKVTVPQLLWEDRVLFALGVLESHGVHVGACIFLVGFICSILFGLHDWRALLAFASRTGGAHLACTG